MGSLTLADLESLLRARKLDGTLISALSVPQRWDEGVVPTGLASLDAQLGGGVQRGHLSEITGPRSTGRTSVLCAVLAATTARGELAALVDTLDTFDPASGAAAGIDLSRLLWIRGSPFIGKGDLLTRTLHRALEALGLVLHADGFGVVALDLADIPTRVIRQVPFTTWMRLSRAIEGSKTACVLLGAAPLARSSAGRTIVLQSTGAARRWSGESDRARVFHGFDVQASVIGRQSIAVSPPMNCRLKVVDCQLPTEL